MKNLIIIDGNALIHRAYHALPPLTVRGGELINAVYGFASILLRVRQDLNPSYLVCAFDLAGPTFRDLKYKEYKAKRVKSPQELYNQIPRVKEVVEAFDIPIYEKQGFEADDVIGTIALKVKDYSSNSGLKIKTFIVTGDLDALQLVDKETVVYTLKKGINNIIIYDQEAVMSRYQLKPNQIVDFKALVGDSSDNIPGVVGIGEKTAIGLLKKFGSLEKIYQAVEMESLDPKLKARLLEYKEDAFLSQDLATIRKDVPINFDLKNSRVEKYDKEKVVKLFEELEFHSLIRRLP